MLSQCSLPNIPFQYILLLIALDLQSHQKFCKASMIYQCPNFVNKFRTGDDFLSISASFRTHVGRMI